MKTVSPAFVNELIDFAPTEETREMGFADAQRDGTVALFNMLQRNKVAYLADEVGMGKTYVALGVMALARYFDPHARIVVIAPRENIQRKWVKELKNFVRHNWRIVGNRVKSLQGEPAWEPVHCDTLIDFVREAMLNADRDFFLRMTSFSLALKQAESRRRLRRRLFKELRWVNRRVLAAKTPDGFRDAFGTALNAGFPDADLLVVDEAHNLKHGYSARGSIRNRIMGLAFGHPEGSDTAGTQFRPRAKRLLLLSATPFEEDYAAIQRQLDIFGFGNAKLHNPDDRHSGSVARLAIPDVVEDEKREIVGQLMVRRVSSLRIGDKEHTKNMYRREWRQGGYERHDDPMRLDDPKQRLIVALMQKKVAEVLQDERFNNSFQIGMLSSFESFLQTVGTSHRRRRHDDDDDEHERDPTFDGAQGRTVHEKQGIDTDAVTSVVTSYRSRFGRGLPHPKLDATADAFASAFETGEKTLVFVRRVRTVEELAAKLDLHFDGWIRKTMVDALPDRLGPEVERLFTQYERERARRPHELTGRPFAQPLIEVEEAELEPDELADDRSVEDLDEGGSESFFAWFFRGEGPSGLLSGAAFQKNRLSGQGSVYSTFFEDDYVAWLLDRPADTVSELATHVNDERGELCSSLRDRAYSLFRALNTRAEGYPRILVFNAYQRAALERLQERGGDLGEKARVVLEERFPHVESGTRQPPAGFPQPDDSLGISTFITELVQRQELRQQIWPEDASTSFLHRFRRREQRRVLLSGLARLGASYIDLYLLAIRRLGSFDLRAQSESGAPQTLAHDFVALLERQMQMQAPGFHAFYELSQAAATFDLLLAVNFPDVGTASLTTLAAKFGDTLQRQVPVGRMHGRVDKRLVRQFRMPGFPLVLASTDVLQEGEDLHTFCRRVVHYGITWTPSAMEQRTGRVDRIGSLVQRNLDGKPQPEDTAWLQVHYPHLQDTVEVLQVRRVLRRLNRFLELIHNKKGDAKESGSRIDTAREMLEVLEEIKPPEGRLESAFPVRAGWLRGTVGPDAVKRDVTLGQEHLLAHLRGLWDTMLDAYSIRQRRSVNPRMLRGFALVRRNELLRRDSESPGTGEKEFEVELRSQAAGDATLLRCRSHVGQLDLKKDDLVDDLYRAQRDFGLVKVCVRREATAMTDDISVEGDLPFHPETTQAGELEVLVSRTVGAAMRLQRKLMPDESGD